MSVIYGKPWAETLFGTANLDWIYGDGGNDVIYAGGAGDIVYGEEGNDALYGQEGNDMLVGGAGGDVVAGGDGIDTASYWNSSAGVTVNLEVGYAHSGDANGDTLSSIENLTGSDHVDYLIGDDNGNVFSGRASNDHLDGKKGNDRLEGGDGADHVFGGEGFDAIRGGAGQDFMAGGSERDVFEFSSVSESAKGASFHDTIMDWGAGGVTDRIDLTGIDARLEFGNQAFSFVDGAFTDVGQVRVAQKNGNTYVYANTAGDHKPEFELELIGTHNLSAVDFYL